MLFLEIALTGEKSWWGWTRCVASFKVCKVCTKYSAVTVQMFSTATNRNEMDKPGRLFLDKDLKLGIIFRLSFYQSAIFSTMNTFVILLDENATFCWKIKQLKSIEYMPRSMNPLPKRSNLISRSLWSTTVKLSRQHSFPQHTMSNFNILFCDIKPVSQWSSCSFRVFYVSEKKWLLTAKWDHKTFITPNGPKASSCGLARVCSQHNRSFLRWQIAFTLRNSKKSFLFLKIAEKKQHNYKMSVCHSVFCEVWPTNIFRPCGTLCVSIQAPRSLSQDEGRKNLFQAYF